MNLGLSSKVKKDSKYISLLPTGMVTVTVSMPNASVKIVKLPFVFYVNLYHQQGQIRTQLASSLRGVVSQELIPINEGCGRVMAIEIMIMTDAIGI